MSMLLDVSPQIEGRIRDIASREGIEPTVLIEKMVQDYQSPPATNDQNELGGKMAGELYGHLLGTVSFGPADLAERDEEYLTQSGFGETRNRRDLSS